MSYLNYTNKNLTVQVHPEISTQEVWGLINPQLAYTAWTLLSEVIWGPQPKSAPKTCVMQQIALEEIHSGLFSLLVFKKIDKDKLKDSTQAAFRSTVCTEMVQKPD